MKFSRISFLSLPNGLRRFSAALRLRKSALSPCPLARCFFMLFFFVSVAVCYFLFVFFFFLWPIRSFLFLLFFYICLVIAFFRCFSFLYSLAFYLVSLCASLIALWVFFLFSLPVLFIFPFLSNSNPYSPIDAACTSYPQSDFSLFVYL